jgi:hypothetical protein
MPIETRIIDNVPTAATLFTLPCAGLLIAASFLYPTPPWRATTVRIGELVLVTRHPAVPTDDLRIWDNTP